MHQQLWEYKVEEKIYLGLRERKRLNTTGLENREMCVRFQGEAHFLYSTAFTADQRTTNLPPERYSDFSRR
jgi:hypothetical protein